ncbi:MAG: hypothetical protein Q7U57_09545 [Methylovulum sp.]|nr:hypothetical protein [Methylovulum sp.]
MPKNIEDALNDANRLRLKIETAPLKEINTAIAAYQHQHKYAYSLLAEWVRCV